ncbi:MAG: dihydroorotase [Calditrichales bacterium]|nr:MAG: dihydroorotase [Calditrichales bacterium]
MLAFNKAETQRAGVDNLPKKLLIRDAHLVDSSEKLNGVKSIIIEDGKIVSVLETAPKSFEGEIIEGKGHLLMPGFFDMHVHLREPGREDEETLKSGSMAAANGGFSGVACMPNTEPAIDTQEIVNFIREQTKDSLVEVYPVAAITKKREGKELSPLAELVEAGAVAISDDGSPVMNAEVMRRALEYSKMFGIPVLGHEEDENLSRNRHMHEGFYSTKLGIQGIPALSEEIMIARDIMLTEYTGGRFHVCHISTKGGVDLVRQARARGVAVTCEVAPHHFTLTDQAVEDFDTNTKMNPPLRSDADRQALIEGLKDGTIDAIATDHAPHSIEEKEAEYIYAPFGITGLETAIGLIFSELFEKKVLNLDDIYRLCVSNPRKILNLDIPAIKEGSFANLTLIDPGKIWKFNQGQTFSKSINSPFKGRELLGKSMAVINKGKIFKSKDF